MLSADQVEPVRLRQALRGHDLELPVISTGQVYADARLWFTQPDAEIRRLAVARVVELIELAGRFGAMVNVGRVRGHVHEGESLKTAEDRFADCMRECARHADEEGVVLLLEPVNRYEINYVNSVIEAIRVVDKLGLANVKLMPDTFHMNIEEVSITGSIREAGKRIGYIHLADSNRRAPGDGHVDFPSVFAALAAIPYDGWATVEILPEPSPDQAAASAISFLRRLVPGPG